jgi:hypothetical protein
MNILELEKWRYFSCGFCGGDSGVHTWTTDGSTLVPVCRRPKES